MRAAQIQSSPGVVPVPRGEKGVQITVEGIRTGIDGSCLPIGGVVHTVLRTNDRPCQLIVGRGLCQTEQHQA